MQCGEDRVGSRKKSGSIVYRATSGRLAYSGGVESDDVVGCSLEARVVWVETVTGGGMYNKKSMNQTCKVANPARGQLKREN